MHAAVRSVGNAIRNFCKSVLELIVGLGFFCFVIVSLAFISSPAGQRLFDHKSRLSFGESRIEHIPSEFQRRSPLFMHAWDAFKLCSRDSTCNSAGMLLVRDEAIRLDWPMVFDYLKVYDDWGTASESADARDEFFREIEQRGEHIVRNKCLPRITFSNVPGDAHYFFQGFECTSAPAS